MVLTAINARNSIHLRWQFSRWPLL